MAIQENLSPFKKCNKGSFELTKLWIEKSEEIELSATAVSVMTALLWHYNPEKKFMYPHQDTIGKRIKRSVATVKRAITELKQKGYLVTTRSRNGNLYALTKKFFDLFEPSESQSCTVEKVQNELCMNIEHVKEQKKEQHKKVVVAFSSNSNKKPGPINMAEIPDIIRENPKIKNVIGYWRSLDDTAKAEYIEKDKEVKELKARREAKEKEQEQRSYENYLKQQALKNAKPFSETCTKEQAISYIKTTYGKSEIMKALAQRSRTVKQLLNRFNIELSQVL